MSGKFVQIDVKDPMIVAPCGVNCSVCRTYIRDRQPCVGCRGGENNKSVACLTCPIMNCMKLASGNHQFCFSCANFPCAELLHLDLRYRTKYGVSTIANLQRIRDVGVKRFIVDENSRWTCPECNSRLCMHTPECGNCGYTWQGKLF